MFSVPIVKIKRRVAQAILNSGWYTMFTVTQVFARKTSVWSLKCHVKSYLLTAAFLRVSNPNENHCMALI